jgi:hypothetical protein
MAAMRLKGYILLESMIAMIIVMLCFGISIMIYNNIATNSRNKLKVEARIQMGNEAIKSKSENRFLDETIEFDEFYLKKKTIAYGKSETLYQLNYTAITPDGFHLAEYNEIISNP